MIRVAVLACAALLCACPSSVGKHPPKDKQVEPEAKDTKVEPEAKDTKDTKVEPDTKVDAQPTDAKLLPGAPLPFTDLLGKAPTDAQTKLGEPTGKGMTRSSCVRFVPERVWFECSYAHQRYTDTTGTYKAVQVSYEDGKAAAVAFEGIPGDDPFDPIQALAKIGLELPSAPHLTEPKAGVKVWSWFNNDARLVLDGLQYRVEVSTVDDKWEHSKIDIILNHPLDAAQQAKVKPAQPKGG